MLENSSPKDLLNTMISKITEVMGIMEIFDLSRPGSIAFTKLEESIMWLQVLCHTIPFKPKDDEFEPEVIDLSDEKKSDE